MGSAVSKNNKDYVNNNWDQLKCSPLGPFLQMIGIAPGDPNSTLNSCKSAEFSSQFNSSMSEHLNITNKLTGGLDIISSTVNKVRKVIASMEQRAFDDISKVATEIFKIYVKIGNIFYIIVKHLINIMNIFKYTINFGVSIGNLLIALIDLIRVPVNLIYVIIAFFTRI
jgi:hypothetical protein